MTQKPIFSDSEWTPQAIERTWNVIEEVAKEVCPPIDYYVPQIEIISAEQMLDAYSSVAMPLMYKHWSFGKEFLKNEQAYKKGQLSLAYEVVINTNPCLVYLMEDNTMTMQTLVMAHAGVGHSGFFKNNYLFKMWTRADTILDYLNYAKTFIAQCETKYGEDTVSRVLDACHALKYYSVDKCKRLTKKRGIVESRQKEREAYSESEFNDLWRTTKSDSAQQTQFQRTFAQARKEAERLKSTYFDLPKPVFPEENLLYFIENYSASNAKSSKWIREICKIVRTLAQYFYPQMQTQLMNEGYATFTHYHMMTALNERGYINDGSYLEFLHSHSSVLFQPSHSSPHFSGINPYALGFAMYQDIKRICEDPTEEDRKWCPTIAGTDWKLTIADVVKNYRDESFIHQFLSPKVIRDFNLFTLYAEEKAKDYIVSYTQGDADILNIRKCLAKEYDLMYSLPQIDVAAVDWLDPDGQTGILQLRYRSIDDKLLNYPALKSTLSYIEFLWGGTVQIGYVDEDGKEITRTTI